MYQNLLIHHNVETAREHRHSKLYFVIEDEEDDNGMRVIHESLVRQDDFVDFEGTYEECRNYIKIQVADYVPVE